MLEMINVPSHKRKEQQRQRIEFIDIIQFSHKAEVTKAFMLKVKDIISVDLLFLANTLLRCIASSLQKISPHTYMNHGPVQYFGRLMLCRQHVALFYDDPMDSNRKTANVGDALGSSSGFHKTYRIVSFGMPDTPRQPCSLSLAYHSRLR